MQHSDYKLPPLLIQSEFASWSEYFDKVYETFVKDFVTSQPIFRGKKLRLKKHPYIDGKEYTFYHLINSGLKEDERLCDINRAERIRWPRPIIENCDSWSLKIWPQVRNGKNRLCIWLQLTDEPDYVVILDVREDYMLPWTAFVLQYEHEKEKKQKEYDVYLKAKTA